MFINRNDIEGKLEFLFSKYKDEEKIKFTEPLVTLTNSMSTEIEWLFERFVMPQDKFANDVSHLTNEMIIDNLKNYFDSIKNVDTEIKYNSGITGYYDSFKFNILIRNLSLAYKKFFQVISFDEIGALRRLKLFDWSVKDTMRKHEKYDSKNFGAIISKPVIENPHYAQRSKGFDQGLKILDDGKYEIIKYDLQEEGWKAKIKELIFS